VKSHHRMQVIGRVGMFGHVSQRFIGSPRHVIGEQGNHSSGVQPLPKDHPQLPSVVGVSACGDIQWRHPGIAQASAGCSRRRNYVASGEGMSCALSVRAPLLPRCMMHTPPRRISHMPAACLVAHPLDAQADSSRPSVFMTAALVNLMVAESVLGVPAPHRAVVGHLRCTKTDALWQRLLPDGVDNRRLTAAIATTTSGRPGRQTTQHHPATGEPFSSCSCCAYRPHFLQMSPPTGPRRKHARRTHSDGHDHGLLAASTRVIHLLYRRGQP
jgi:hypothetical protein